MADQINGVMVNVEYDDFVTAHFAHSHVSAEVLVEKVYQKYAHQYEQVPIVLMLHKEWSHELGVRKLYMISLEIIRLMHAMTAHAKSKQLY